MQVIKENIIFSIFVHTTNIPSGVIFKKDSSENPIFIKYYRCLKFIYKVTIVGIKKESPVKLFWLPIVKRNF